MANHVVIGAGASGLYTAYRLLKGGTLQKGDTVQVYESGKRPGGRILTYEFPPPIGQHGLYAEFGGMRFAVDGKFPARMAEGHVLVQNMIVELGLADKVVPFIESDTQPGNPSSGRLYYLRGTNAYENSLLTPESLEQLPYRFSAQFRKFVEGISNDPPAPYTSDTLLGAIAGKFVPGHLGSANRDRLQWCRYFAGAAIAPGQGSAVFPAGTRIHDIGYWNLLYDQFGDEGFDYAADGAGYTSNVINWNSADAMQANNDYGSGTSYRRLDGGYGQLFTKLAREIESLAAGFPGSGIFYEHTARSVAELPDGQSSCVFLSHGVERAVAADCLFLAMPRKSLELLARGCSANYLLNQEKVQYYIQSSIDQPAVKVVMIFDSPWWSSTALCKYPPCLVNPRPQQKVAVPPGQWVGGPTITDLPLRQVYYFANNVPGGPGVSGGPYVLLASYDDENYSDFWRVLENTGDLSEKPSWEDQPLHGPTAVKTDSPMARMLMKQLAEVHGADLDKLPAPLAVYYQDWGQNPYGGGYHGWAAHYNICQAMDVIRAPYQKILNGNRHRTYVIGSCYSFDQAWVEGAFCTAESVLQEFLHLAPFRGVKDGNGLKDETGEYLMVCR